MGLESVGPQQEIQYGLLQQIKNFLPEGDPDRIAIETAQENATVIFEGEEGPYSDGTILSNGAVSVDEFSTAMDQHGFNWGEDGYRRFVNDTGVLHMDPLFFHHGNEYQDEYLSPPEHMTLQDILSKYEVLLETLNPPIVEESPEIPLPVTDPREKIYFRELDRIKEFLPADHPDRVILEIAQENATFDFDPNMEGRHAESLTLSNGAASSEELVAHMAGRDDRWSEEGLKNYVMTTGALHTDRSFFHHGVEYEDGYDAREHVTIQDILSKYDSIVESQDRVPIDFDLTSPQEWAVMDLTVQASDLSAQLFSTYGDEEAAGVYDFLGWVGTSSGRGEIEKGVLTETLDDIKYLQRLAMTLRQDVRENLPSHPSSPGYIDIEEVEDEFNRKYKELTGFPFNSNEFNPETLDLSVFESVHEETGYYSGIGSGYLKELKQAVNDLKAREAVRGGRINMGLGAAVTATATIPILMPFYPIVAIVSGVLDVADISVRLLQGDKTALADIGREALNYIPFGKIAGGVMKWGGMAFKGATQPIINLFSKAGNFAFGAR